MILNILKKLIAWLERREKIKQGICPDCNEKFIHRDSPGLGIYYGCVNSNCVNGNPAGCL